MKEIKVSIIVPCYNAQNYLDKCLNSILKQTYKNIELICINDGSTDNTLNILKKYKKNDTRVKIIDKKNEGVSAARNDGIKNSIGSYILFVDSDDYIELNMVEYLLNKAIHFSADIVKCNRSDVYDDGKIVLRAPLWNKETVIESSEFAEKIYPEFFRRNKLCNIWMTLIKKDLIIDNNFYFLRELKVNEDEWFSAQIFSKANRFVYIPKNFYYYVKNNNGLSTSGADIYARYESRKKHLELFEKLSLKWGINNYEEKIVEKKAFVIIHTAFQTSAVNYKYKVKEQYNLFKEIVTNKDFNCCIRNCKMHIMLFPEKILTILIKMKLYYIGFIYARLFENIVRKYRKSLEKLRTNK